MVRGSAQRPGRLKVIKRAKVGIQKSINLSTTDQKKPRIQIGTTDHAKTPPIERLSRNLPGS